MKLRALLLALVVAAAALTGFLATRGEPTATHPLVRTDGSYRVGSLPDDEAAAAVRAAARAVPAALSYDYRTLDKGLDSATKLMTGSFATEFRTTFDKTARPLAIREQAVTRTLVRGAGLVRLDGKDKATCLVYVDQLLVSSKDNRAAAPEHVQQNRVTVQLRREGGAWKVDGIDPF
jgi:Mce-associated membrane protein